MRPACAAGQRGATLVEVIVATALLAIGAFAILTGVRVAGLTTAQVGRRAEAAAIAQRCVEENRYRSSAEPYHESGPAPGHAAYEMELQITPYGDSGSLVQVSAAVWHRHDPTLRAEYTTVVRIGP